MSTENLGEFKIGVIKILGQGISDVIIQPRGPLAVFLDVVVHEVASMKACHIDSDGCLDIIVVFHPSDIVLSVMERE